MYTYMYVYLSLSLYTYKHKYIYIYIYMHMNNNTAHYGNALYGRARGGVTALGFLSVLLFVYGNSR